MTMKRGRCKSVMSEQTAYHASKASGGVSEAICEILAAFALIDGKLDDRERALIEEFSEDFGFGVDDLSAALSELATSGSAAATITENIPKVTDPELRELVAAAVFEICQADEVLHEREKQFLEIIEHHWKVDLSFISKPIEWDDSQKSVVFAPADARMAVSAGPGMGKTAVACAKVSHLIEEEGVRSANIWMVSFTRTAVSEIGDRISTFAENPDEMIGVSIATIDSKAWRLRNGFDAKAAKKLFGGFDTALQKAVDMIRVEEESYRDFFEDIEHVIIDEAQDINGIRATFLIEILRLLQPDCGITVFHDPAQAIYDYETREAVEKDVPFVELLKQAGLLKDGSCELKKIHRTKDPALLRLYEDLRLDVLSGATDRFEEQKRLVEEAAHEHLEGRFDPRHLAKYEHALVLFRKRAQAVMASSFMCSSGHEHRIRMAGYPRCMKPWVAASLAGITDDVLTKPEFERRIYDLYSKGFTDFLGLDHPDPAIFAEKSWAQICKPETRVRGSTDKISLARLRERLSASPYEELLRKEVGVRGPIIGTIHSSKGREAQDVILNISKAWAPDETTPASAAEEGRVLFVGASRAQGRLITGQGFEARFSSSLDRSGRVYRRGKKGGCQVQIGLEGDVDSEIPQQRYTLAELLQLGLPVRCKAILKEHADHDWVWSLEPKDEPASKGAFGLFSTNMKRDISQVGQNSYSRWKAGSPINNLYVVDWKSCVRPISASNEQYDDAPSFWLSPVVIGFPMIYYKYG